MASPQKTNTYSWRDLVQKADAPDWQHERDYIQAYTFSSGRTFTVYEPPNTKYTWVD